ncbi:MAG TPA: HpcH/HpaI aldolase/citrate lyase family protein [Rhodoglobus sp.]|nr:HpcH/HpaI aldolase/citrate lyase family protein [Actinomycetota bacterium]HPU03798.1 HpcH/HpaI aldolase/citrate lyase family protein [Rhodoglobus sp.]HQI65819.1 HpcH/HpaI aldolase/citrate lyase family protein [Rhodoglobus sp.]
MSVRLEPPLSFASRLRDSTRALVGVWVCSGSPTVAEICAGSGVDWVLIDSEHAPNGLESILAQLHAVQGYPATPVVRTPHGDPNLIKQYLDLGVQNLLVPMVNTAADAEQLVRAVRYPPLGMRGVGSALARASRWNRVDNYLHRAGEFISLFVQVETGAAVGNIDEILSVDGIDGVFVGPSDLAASMGLLGQQDHPDVVAAVEHVIARARQAGRPVGVNAFAPALAERYIDGGIDFILVAADVSLLARSTEEIAARFIADTSDERRTSY